MQRTLDISRDNDAFHVVFDGVETLDQVEFIRSIGGTFCGGHAVEQRHERQRVPHASRNHGHFIARSRSEAS